MQSHLPVQFCQDPSDIPGLPERGRSTDPHLGAVLGDKDAQRLVWAAKQALGKAALGALFA